MKAGINITLGFKNGLKMCGYLKTVGRDLARGDTVLSAVDLEVDIPVVTSLLFRGGLVAGRAHRRRRVDGRI